MTEKKLIYIAKKLIYINNRINIYYQRSWFICVAENNTSTIFGVAEQFMKNGGGGTQFEFGKLSMSAEDFGNFHYGVVGDATNLFSEHTLLREAGTAQINSHTSRPEWVKYAPSRGTGHGGTNRELLPPYGDDPADQKMIQNGFNYYNSTSGN